MLLVTKIDEDYKNLQTEYADNVVILTSSIDNDTNALIKFLEDIKKNILKYELVVINYNKLVLDCLNKLEIKYYITNNLGLENYSIYSNVIDVNGTVNQTLGAYFGWINKPELPIADVESNNDLTLEKLATQDVTITDANIRQAKMIETKAKVAMYLQVDVQIKRLYRLLDTINLLEDEMLSRVASDVHTTDTGSLLQVTKCLNDTLSSINSLIMSIVNNDKIQNFFVIDNSKNVNIETGLMTAESRDKVRKAIEIITQNLDMFKEGNISNLQDPNNIVEVKSNATTTESI